MAREDKPYRVYRGGRASGGVPTLPGIPKPQRRKKPTREPKTPRRYAGPGPAKRPRRWGPGRIIFLVVLALILLLVGWTVAGYLSVRSGMEKANARLGEGAKAQLAPDDGWMLSSPSVTLVVGVEHSRNAARRTNLADSIMLMRTDPELHRVTYLSIPRDLEVDVPGYGHEKINTTTAFANGSPQLTIRTIRESLGIEVNHVIKLDFPSFRGVIDALGGIEIDVPKPAVTKIECPYASPARCDRWGGWRYGRGRQHMNGRRALIYSRIRTNLLDPRETDLNRVARQQQVLQATLDKMVSFRTYLKLPFIGDELVSPLATDLTTNELFQLSWVRYRAGHGRTIYCRLGITGDGDYNATVLLMFAGRSAIQRPSAVTGGAGCVRGSPLT